MPDAPRNPRLYYIASALALIICLWGLVGQARVGGLPASFRAERLRYPVRVERVPVRSPRQLATLVQRYRPGKVLAIESGDRTHRVRVVGALTSYRIIVSLFSGLFLWAVSTFVFATRVDRGPIRDLYWGLLLYAIAVMVGGIYTPSSPLWPNALRPLLRIFALVLLPLLFVHLSLTFPRRRPVLDRRPEIMLVLLGLGAVAFAWQGWAALRYYTEPGPVTWQGLRIPEVLTNLFLIAGDGAGCIILFQNSRAVELAREKRQVKWLLWGITLGVAPYAFLYVLPMMVQGRPAIPLELARIATITIPISFTFAVIRYQFLDIDIIIRRSLIYGILAGAMVALYLFIGVLIGRWLMLLLPQFSDAIPVLAIVVPVILFRPTRRMIGAWVDRTFFKIQYNYGQALGTLREAVHRASSQPELAELLRRFLKEQLLLKNVAVLARVGGEIESSGHLREGLRRDAFSLCERLLEQRDRAIAVPNRTSMPEVETPEFPRPLLDSHFVLVEPLRADGRCLGLILVGEKASERRFVEEDLKLLSSAGAEASIALDRMDLMQRYAEEVMARQRLDELDRVKNDFFSRVAHDLRTPVTSITWTVQNLLDGVAGAPAPGHVPYLEAVKASAGQLGRLVSNLLDLSRLEQPDARIEMGPVEVGAVVEEAVMILSPIAWSRKIRCEVRAEPGLGPVRANREKLFEVATNLLDNAVRYSPPESAVEIAIRRRQTGGQELIVRDHGPGLKEVEREIIFERFHQGRPSPYTRQHGFGLGLYVARSYLELMGGSVAAENHPEGGARFVCSLSEFGTT